MNFLVSVNYLYLYESNVFLYTLCLEVCLLDSHLCVLWWVCDADRCHLGQGSKECWAGTVCVCVFVCRWVFGWAYMRV